MYCLEKFRNVEQSCVRLSQRQGTHCIAKVKKSKGKQRKAVEMPRFVLFGKCKVLQSDVAKEETWKENTTCCRR